MVSPSFLTMDEGYACMFSSQKKNSKSMHSLWLQVMKKVVRVIVPS